MPVPSSIVDLSAVAGSNYPSGSESPSTADDYFRAHASFIAKLRAVVGGTVDPEIPSVYDSIAAAEDPLKGAAMIGYRGRSLYASLSETIDAKDRGAKGDNATNDYVALAACVTEAQGRPTGARIKIPAGVYKVNSTLDLWPIVGIGWHNLMIEGDGAGITVLDFSGAPVGSDGIAIHGWGGRIAINGLSVIGAPGVGLNFNAGEVRGGASWVSRVSMRDVVVDGCGSDGIRFLQVYMGGFENVESRNNGGYGFNLQGFHTSMMFDRCWAGGDAVYPNGGNLMAGWFVNGLVYSHFSACSSDQNAGPGWIIQNTGGVVQSGCGSESNGMEGWLLRSRILDTNGIPSVSQNINGLILDGCFAIDNSKAEINTYANFLGAVTADARPIDVQMRGCVDGDEIGILTSITLNAASGPIYIHEQSNHFVGSVSSTGPVSRQNNTVVGRSALAKLSADQAVPNAADTAIAFDTLIGNRMQAAVSGGAIVIPAGVSRVKVTAGVFWDSSSTGDRSIRIVKNGLTFDGCPQQKTAPSGYTGQALTSAIIEVAPGDTFGAIVFQSSGGSLNAISNGSTFISVEAIG